MLYQQQLHILDMLQLMQQDLMNKILLVLIIQSNSLYLNQLQLWLYMSAVIVLICWYYIGVGGGGSGDGYVDDGIGYMGEW